jgi:hypothetical protein
MRSTRSAGRVVLAAALVVLFAHPTGAAVQVARGEAGVTVSATGESLATVLERLADAEGFAVTMQEGIERHPVDVDVRDATVEEALRAVLRGNNYVIAYDDTGDGLAVSRVEVLLPRPADVPPRNAPMERAQAAMRAAQQRKEARQQQEAQQRAAQLRAARLQQRQAVQQARAQQQQQQAPEPVPLRRMLWGRSR